MRAIRSRVYDREGYIGRIQWGGCAVAVLALILGLVFQPNNLRHHYTGIKFLAPIWTGILALVALFSASSMVGERRRGFLDLVLLTPLDPAQILDGTLYAVWEHSRRTYWLAVSVTALFCLIGASTVIGGLCSLITATLFGVLLASYGIGCSIMARSAGAALAATFVFALGVNLGWVFILRLFPDEAGPVAWVLSTLLFFLAWLALRQRVTVATVAFYLAALHLVLASAATAWTWGWDRSTHEYPIVAMIPMVVTLTPLDGRSDRDWFFPGPPAYLLLPAYWLGLIANIYFVRRWLITHFDRLTERIGPR
jgi:hypothetical protein